MKSLYFEESEFEFLAYGKDANITYETLKLAWKEHCALTGADYTRLNRRATKPHKAIDIVVDTAFRARENQVYRKHVSEPEYRLYYTLPDNMAVLPKEYDNPGGPTPKEFMDAVDEAQKMDVKITFHDEFLLEYHLYITTLPELPTSLREIKQAIKGFLESKKHG